MYKRQIQDSPDLFHLSLEDTARLTAQYPQLTGHAAGVVDVPRYIHEDGQTTANKSVVVDWYYKRPDENGKLRLHYCKLCNGVVLYASQNDPALAARGLYDHGKYPFVFDPLFVEEDSPAGFGYIDVMKDCQNAIDKMNHAMDENVLLASRQRYVLSDTAGVNEEELADLSRDIVHVVGRLNEDSFRPLQTAGLQGNSLSYRNSRIEELKEISGNRDLTQGGTTGGVTAASAIAALQEAGSKLSRDMLKSAYRAFARQCYLVIELMRQFYDEQRVFRITGQRGESEFVPFSAQGLRAKPVPAVGGVELGSREAMVAFCKGIQSAAPVDSYVTPEPWAMPGYESEVIMAAGAFVQGASIELSADGPIRPPYAVYFQGGLTWFHAKLGILMSIQKLLDAGIIEM